MSNRIMDTGVKPRYDKLGSRYDKLGSRYDRRGAVALDELQALPPPSGMTYFVYILASKPSGTLYIGVTNDLARRIWEHRSGAVPGFTKRYGVGRLVYMEPHDDIQTAIQREKTLKEWQRRWKIDLIERDNPRWDDLFPLLNA